VGMNEEDLKILMIPMVSPMSHHRNWWHFSCINIDSGKNIMFRSFVVGTTYDLWLIRFIILGYDSSLENSLACLCRMVEWTYPLVY
jgi:hypothetical protein